MAKHGKPAVTLEYLRKTLRGEASVEDAQFLQRFFKTGPGEYAEGDQFIGVRVPATRRVARLGSDLPMKDLKHLLKSPIHEERLLALLILVKRFERGDRKTRDGIAALYLGHLGHVNNWDLVDSSAPQILGGWLRDHPGEKIRLYALARSADLWDRRIAMLATFAFIRAGDMEPALRVATLLLKDPHDLIHKASGWMLRETGLRHAAALREFLAEHAAIMPRTMLRYAVERLEKPERQRWMNARRANR